MAETSTPSGARYDPLHAVCVRNQDGSGFPQPGRPSVRAMEARRLEPLAKALTLRCRWARSAAPALRAHRHGRTARATWPKSRGFVRVQCPRAIQAQGQRRRGCRLQQQRACNGKQREPKAAFAEQQAPRSGCNPDQGQDQQPRLQAVEQAMLQQRRAQVTGMMTGHAQMSRRRGRRARAAASRSHPEPAWRLPARLSLRGSRRSRGSRTCGRVRSARSGPPS